MKLLILQPCNSSILKTFTDHGYSFQKGQINIYLQKTSQCQACMESTTQVHVNEMLH